MQPLQTQSILCKNGQTAFDFFICRLYIVEIISFRLKSIAQKSTTNKEYLAPVKNSNFLIQKHNEEVFTFHFGLGSMKTGHYIL